MADQLSEEDDYEDRDEWGWVPVIFLGIVPLSAVIVCGIVAMVRLCGGLFG